MYEDYFYFLLFENFGVSTVDRLSAVFFCILSTLVAVMSSVCWAADFQLASKAACVLILGECWGPTWRLTVLQLAEFIGGHS